MSELVYGVVSALDYTTCRLRCRLEARDGVQTYWLHIPQINGQGTKRRAMPFEIGEQVAVLLHQNGVDGVVLGSIYSSIEPPPVADADTDFVRFKDGTTISYNQAQSVLQVKCVGDVQLHAVNVSAQMQTLTAKANTIDVQAQSVQVKANEVAITAQSAAISAQQSSITGAIGLKGDLSVQGNIEVAGNIHASGSVMDAGGNSNHHSH